MSNEKNQETAVCDLTDNVFNPQETSLEYRQAKIQLRKSLIQHLHKYCVETIEELSKKVE